MPMCEVGKRYVGFDDGPQVCFRSSDLWTSRCNLLSLFVNFRRNGDVLLLRVRRRRSGLSRGRPNCDYYRVFRRNLVLLRRIDVCYLRGVAFAS